MQERGNSFLKIADKYAGIPLVFTLGILKKKRKFDKELLEKHQKSFLLLKTAGIGDTIVLSAAAREIKRAWPGSHLTLLCSKNNYEIAGYLNCFDKIYIFDILKPINSLIKVISLGPFDFLLDFAPWARINSIISYFARAKFKVGFKRKGMHRHYVYDLFVEHEDKGHEIENYRKILRAICIQPAGLLPEINVDSAAGGIPFENAIVFHPYPGGAKSTLKEWPANNWVKLGRELIKRNYNVIITGGKKDAARAGALEEQINGGLKTKMCTSLAGKLTLMEVGELIKESRVLVSVNTGTMHLGAAVGANIVALHGPTSPGRWGPLSDKAVVLIPKVPCHPCLSLGFEYGCKGGGCMETISVEEVLAAAEQFLL